MSNWEVALYRAVGLLWLCLAQTGEADRGCNRGELVLTSVKYIQCRRRAAEQLTFQSGTIYAQQYQGGRYSVCDFLTELRRDCLPLYSMCLRGRQLQAVEQMWVRQEVKATQLYSAPGQILNCPGLDAVLGRDEVDEAKLMLRTMDWNTDSRNCRWNLDYEVSHERPILWLFSILRCDGSCDAQNRLKSPYRISPRNPSPPKAYRKKVRVVNYNDPGYLNQVMNNTVTDYQECLDSVGPFWSASDQARVGLAEDMQQYEDMQVFRRRQRRGCASLEKYVEECVPLLGRCLGPGTMEEIVAREGEELISRVEEGVRQSPGSEKFSHTFCQVFGGHISGAGNRGIGTEVVAISLILLALQLLAIIVW